MSHANQGLNVVVIDFLEQRSGGTVYRIPRNRDRNRVAVTRCRRYAALNIAVNSFSINPEVVGTTTWLFDPKNARFAPDSHESSRILIQLVLIDD